jgi:hypothetical protein
MIVPMTMARNVVTGCDNSLKHHTTMQALYFAWYKLGRKHESLGGDTTCDG